MNDDRDTIYNLPPVYHRVEKHGVFPELSHDENARFNFLTSLNRHLNRLVEPGAKAVFEKRVKPVFETQTGRRFVSVDDIQQAMGQEPLYQLGSALQRSAIEMIQQASRSVVLRQVDELTEKARYYTNQRPETLRLDPAIEIPRYLKMIDQGCMPGSYYTEYRQDDVTNAANYDASQFLMTDGRLGKRSDAIGRGLVSWLQLNYPKFLPVRILDIGCGIGHNTMPVAKGYPDAEVIGVDVSAPMLRYGHARSVAQNVNNVIFWQADAERLPFADNSFDLLFTTRFLHTISTQAAEVIFQEIYRILKPNGLMLHIDQVDYPANTPLFDQFMNNWRALANNEPYGIVMDQKAIDKWLQSAGFTETNRLRFGIELPGEDNGILAEAGIQHGEPQIQHAFGAWK